MRFLRDVAVSVAGTLVVNAVGLMFAGLAGLNPEATWATAVQRYGLANAAGTVIWFIGGIGFSIYLFYGGVENWWYLKMMKESDEKAIPIVEQMEAAARQRERSSPGWFFEEPYQPRPLVYGVDFAKGLKRDVYPLLGFGVLALACTVAAGIAVSYFYL